MTSSTCSTVSTEEVKRFAEQMAQELGLTELLHMELWATPNLCNLTIPDSLCQMRNSQLRLRSEKMR
ncbi:hypothetical protein CIG75_09970 [Tumebacillus algifaecis]|uniref:Uncharacterized protein n=1 Tax=Tumebacillus algifaecis TaxID=1214604 RepID=A0A223D0Z1_9BACL|nr:hypothetical protein [Tumebacillus algifaecis]ASS75280.1 hypothetical protein CIG75_09970 [Tumebacillus algifaecis]